MLLYTLYLTPINIVLVIRKSCPPKRAQTFSTCHCWLGVWECHQTLGRALSDQLGDPILFTLIAWFVVVFQREKKKLRVVGCQGGNENIITFMAGHLNYICWLLGH